MKTVNVGTLHKPALSFDQFEALADASARAVFSVDGHELDTAGMRVTGGEVVATRVLKAVLRRELRAAGFEIWAKGRTWR